ncbi:hypothetical protein JL721_9448 [Aureococcus anophagefferens]|nr:hypothetical protein JL721_9448 [Aureococcus anophagefferens]
MRVTCSALLVAVACAFAPAPQPAATRGQALRMKKPSPATEAGPLPGLSENNYAVLAGVAATGLLAPALLFAPTLLPAPAPAAKGKTSAKAPAPKGPGFSLPSLPAKEKSEAAPKKKTTMTPEQAAAKEAKPRAKKVVAVADPAAPVLTAKPGANLGVKKATSNANEAANTGGAAKATSLNVEKISDDSIAAAPPSARSTERARARGGAGSTTGTGGLRAARAAPVAGICPFPAYFNIER